MYTLKKNNNFPLDILCTLLMLVHTWYEESTPPLGVQLSLELGKHVILIHLHIEYFHLKSSICIRNEQILGRFKSNRFRTSKK